jgi:hypothetical protein
MCSQVQVDVSLNGRKERVLLIMKRKFCLSKIHPAETFPLILALGIMVQGFVFAAVSGEGLQSLFISNCGVVAQFTWVGKYCG